MHVCVQVVFPPKAIDILFFELCGRTADYEVSRSIKLYLELGSFYILNTLFHLSTSISSLKGLIKNQASLVAQMVVKESSAMQTPGDAELRSTLREGSGLP